MPAPFRLYNTLTRRVEDFEPRVPGQIGLYVCGMTVYDRAHVGHARAFVIFDAFVRYLRHRGWSVRYVRNFTDVDDKIIKRAAELGEDPIALSARFIDAFRDDTAALGLDAPDVQPKVTESMGDIIRIIAELVAEGHAYVAEGTVWYSVDSFPEYGKLSGQRPDSLQSLEDVAGKESALDFALWKAAKPGEPAWDSPWGRGRPGWHIECSAMSRAELGDTFDIHGGGLDLVFPHHENEIAQSEAATGEPFARYWMHNGLLTMAGGQKMGKSLGNVINVDVALARFPAEALRLYYLQNKYRSPLPWSEEALPEALSMLARLYEAKEAAQSLEGSEDADRVADQMGAEAQEVLALGRAFPERFHAALDEDFNTAEALGHLFTLARAVNRFAGVKKAKKRGGPVVAPALAAIDLVSEALGLLGGDVDSFQAEVKEKRLRALGIDPDRVEGLLEDRRQARADKDWPRADRIREELESMQICVMDTSDGARWRVRL